jgi:hypothetical protein
LFNVYRTFRKLQENKLEYDIFYNKIQSEKNKKHIQNINKSICLID